MTRAAQLFATLLQEVATAIGGGVIALWIECEQATEDGQCFIDAQGFELELTERDEHERIGAVALQNGLIQSHGIAVTALRVQCRGEQLQRTQVVGEVVEADEDGLGFAQFAATKAVGSGAQHALGVVCPKPKHIAEIGHVPRLSPSAEHDQPDRRIVAHSAQIQDAGG